MQVVVLGVGNLLMTDEGVGVHAVNALERDWVFPEGVRCVDGGTSTQELLGDLEDLDQLIVLDAVTSASAPGTLIRLEGAQVPQAFTTKFSPHQVGIADLLAMLTFSGHAPKRVLVFGVEPAVLKLGMELSPVVAGRVPELCAQVIAELRQLGLTPTQRLSEVA
ncbi:MAG: HyaD/HybD family hydrogenase maturation endopeptidase [Archangium sp.]|nr:HyaD/HybD family hydrogenase maturation endopeptidase [Archangium sp.]